MGLFAKKPRIKRSYHHRSHNDIATAKAEKMFGEMAARNPALWNSDVKRYLGDLGLPAHDLPARRSGGRSPAVATHAFMQRPQRRRF